MIFKRNISLINIILSAVFIISCFINCIQTEIYTTTTTTRQPFIRSPGLSLPQRNVNPPKCTKEEPAVFLQLEKDVPMVGNSTINPFYNVIEVCCHGYKRYDFDWSKCVPDCGKKCQRNGFCLEGGVCQCFDEFVLNHRNDCVPICPLGCPNGQCFLNGTCICDRGFELDPTKKYCIPMCEKGCGHNEVCDAPDQCICAEGYAKVEDPYSEKMGCQPLCIPDCGFGRCVGPNQCECFPGFIKRENKTVCENFCYMRCENGFCFNSTHCACQNGYKYDLNSTSCLPDCGDSCDNGVCISPGVCRCFNNFIWTGRKCEAVCKHGCGYYGKCIAPDVCGCALIDGPLKNYQHCDLGYCTSKGRCNCQAGTTRFISMCLSPDGVTTKASTKPDRFNNALIDEFNLLIGQHFNITGITGLEFYG